MRIAMLILAAFFMLVLVAGSAQDGSAISLLFAFVGGALFENIVRALK